MTDIVERLRVHAQITTNLLNEVAEEIERLQLELQAANFCINVHIGERNIARLHVERLEEANAKLRESKHEHSNDR